MNNDPIVEEIHRIRAERLAESGGSLDDYMDRLQRLEAEERGQLITSLDDLKSKKKAASAA